MSLYYGRSPYLENRTGKRNSRRKPFAYHRTLATASFMKSLPGLRRKARHSLVFGAQKSSDAIKTGAQVFSGAMRAAKNVGRAKVRFEFGPGTVMAGMMVLAVGLSFAYLAYFNQVATRGYEMTRLEADRQQLLNQYEIKNMKLAEIRSLNYIAGTDHVSAMGRPGTVEFVRGDTAIALK